MVMDKSEAETQLPEDPEQDAYTPHPSFRQALKFWIKLGFISFGGPAGQISIKLGARGPSVAHVSACTSSAHSIGEALRVIQRGDADVMLAGATGTRLHPMKIIHAVQQGVTRFSVLIPLGLAFLAGLTSRASSASAPPQRARWVHGVPPTRWRVEPGRTHLK